jgi:hypothetical protein
MRRRTSLSAWAESCQTSSMNLSRTQHLLLSQEDASRSYSGRICTCQGSRVAGHHENILFYSWKHLEAKGGATFACYALYQDKTTHLSPQHVAREESRELLRGKSFDASNSANRFWTTYRNKE